MTEHALVKADHSIDALEKMGHYIATSGLFGVKNPTQAVALMLIAQAEGRHPASAAQDYHIIQNRPSLKADTMLARFQAAGGKVKWVSYTDTKVAGEFSHPQGGTVLIDWDMDRAKRAGLGAKDNWKTYPRSMLRARVISEGVRTVYPAVLSGMYTPEEVYDFTPEPLPEPEASLPAAKKQKPTKEPPDALFNKMVAGWCIGDATAPYLTKYLDHLVQTTDKPLDKIMAKAVAKEDDFWAGFQRFFNDQLATDDDTPGPPPAEDGVELELEGI